MSHFATLVLTNTGTDEEVSRLLAPYDENQVAFADGSRWDWWVIGGRFSGLLDGYDPTQDPVNIKICDLCSGTGERPGGREQFGDAWHEWCNGCNGCHGTGQTLKFASQWRPHDGDRMPARDLSFDDERVPHAVVTPDGRWHENERMGWWGQTIPNERGDEPAPEDMWAAAVTALVEQHPDAIAYVVDCHV